MPDLTACRSVLIGAQNLKQYPTINVTPLARVASINSLKPSSRAASGFSTNTGTPRRTNSSAVDRCEDAGPAISAAEGLQASASSSEYTVRDSFEELHLSCGLR